MSKKEIIKRRKAIDEVIKIVRETFVKNKAKRITAPLEDIRFAYGVALDCLNEKEEK